MLLLRGFLFLLVHDLRGRRAGNRPASAVLSTGEQTQPEV
jgi:hypothetical protein